MDMVSLALQKAVKFESEGKKEEAEHWLELALKAEDKEKNKKVGVVVEKIAPQSVL